MSDTKAILVCFRCQHITKKLFSCGHCENYVCAACFFHHVCECFKRKSQLEKR
jgi:hypothetical protein